MYRGGFTMRGLVLCAGLLHAEAFRASRIGKPRHAYGCTRLHATEAAALTAAAEQACCSHLPHALPDTVALSERFELLKQLFVAARVRTASHEYFSNAHVFGRLRVDGM